MDGEDRSLLRNGRSVRLWLGQGLSFVGDFISTVALVLPVVDISGPRPIYLLAAAPDRKKRPGYENPP